MAEFKQFLSAMREPVSAVEIKDGTGMVGTVGDVHTVVLRTGGALHALTAICTHQRCVVVFKSETTSLDCPCHGSRFNVDGSVLRGPAESPLASYPVEERDGFVWVKR